MNDLTMLRLGLTEINSSDFCRYRDQRLRRVKRNTIVRKFWLFRTAVSTAIDKWNIKVGNLPEGYHVRRELDQ